MTISVKDSDLMKANFTGDYKINDSVAFFFSRSAPEWVICAFGHFPSSMLWFVGSLCSKPLDGACSFGITKNTTNHNGHEGAAAYFIS